MKLKYQIKEIIHTGKVVAIIFVFEKKYDLLTTFLSADVSPFSDYVIEALDNVLSERKEFERINGNICGCEIYKDKTKIYDNLADDGIGNWCEVETEELRELVDIWLNEFKKFRKEHPYG